MGRWNSIAERPKGLFVQTPPESADGAIVEIRDQGVGIKDPAKAFEALYVTKENTIGRGVGICGSIIDAHHGHLWAASSEVPGPTVCFPISFQSSRMQ
jgi:signal transduction histidine kinase